MKVHERSSTSVINREALEKIKKSPLMGSLREKEGQHPVLEVYYFHIS